MYNYTLLPLLVVQSPLMLENPRLENYTPFALSSLVWYRTVLSFLFRLRSFTQEVHSLDELDWLHFFKTNSPQAEPVISIISPTFTDRLTKP